MGVLFDFECKKCKIVFEQFVSDSDSSNPRCPDCNQKTEKKLTFGGYHIKGDNSASVRPSQAGSFKKK